MVSEEEYLNSKILIVDDSDDNVNLLESILLDAGYENIRSTMDPREAAPIYKEMEPDLVLLDLNMPHLNGIQVMEQLNAIEQGSYLSVMVLTAQNDQATKIEALNAGAQDFLSKPFDFLEVNLRIKKMLQIKVLTNQTKQQKDNLEVIVSERTKELHETRMETIYRLGRAAEFRDNETGLHVVRMSRISARLAKEIGLDREECELILHASPMHDIGKIGIPDNILLKPGKLDHDEWKVMQTHSSIGAQILSRGRHKLTKLAKTIALCHHEKWDGSGYPNGLSGDKIPLPARIVSIADCFDALTSVRPYKQAWSFEETATEMDRVTGENFDPGLMKSFQKILPEIWKIKEALPDEERRVSDIEPDEERRASDTDPEKIEP